HYCHSSNTLSSHDYDWSPSLCPVCFFFCTCTSPTHIYTLSLTTLFRSKREQPEPYQPDNPGWRNHPALWRVRLRQDDADPADQRDRKSTRLNSSHVSSSYAVFCLKKKKHEYGSGDRDKMIDTAKTNDDV